MDYEYCYSNAKSRYYNACSEITACQNTLGELSQQKQNTINRINQLQTEMSEYQTAYEQVTQIMGNQSNLDLKIKNITNKTASASDNYSGMVVASDVSGKSLSMVYGEKTAKVKHTMADVFDTLRSKEAVLAAKITELRDQFRVAEQELDNIKSKISSATSNKSEWERTKKNAAYDMEYYRRKMQEAV